MAVSVESENRSALTKALQILDTILSEDSPRTIVEIGRQLNLPRQTAHRLVDQLELAGLVSRPLGKRGFTVGPRLTALSVSTLRQAWHQGAMHAVLEKLGVQIQVTCVIAVIERDAVVIVDSANKEQLADIDLTHRFPVHATACGKLLASFRNARARKRLAHGVRYDKLTDSTITDGGALEAVFDQITRRGYSLSLQEYQRNIVELAVPVRDQGNTVIAALGAIAHTDSLSGRELELKRDFLYKAAESLERQIELG